MKSELIIFDEWLPDMPDIGYKGLSDIIDAVPTVGGYVNAKTPSLVGIAALPSLPNNARQFDVEGDIYAGTSTALYKASTLDSSWTDVSKSGGYTNANKWEFEKYGDVVIAVDGNVVSVPQSYNEGVSTSFGDLSASAPKARVIGVVGDHVILGSTITGANPEDKQRIWWSANGDPTDFTPDIVTGSNYVDLNSEYGQVVAIYGGEYGVVMQERAITIINRASPPQWFDIDKAKIPNIGQTSIGGGVRVGNDIYFLSNIGFAVLRDGTRIELIGKGKFDDWVKSNIPILTGGINCIYSDALDCVVWDLGSVYIYYHVPTGKASKVTPTMRPIFQAKEEVTDSLGVHYYGFDASNNLGKLTASGSPKTAEITTKVLALTDYSNRLEIHDVFPVLDGATAQVKLLHKDSGSDSYIDTGYQAVGESNKVNFRIMDRYIKVGLSINVQATCIHGIVVEYLPRGGAK